MSPNEALDAIAALCESGDSWLVKEVRAILADVSPEPHVIDRDALLALLLEVARDKGIVREDGGTWEPDATITLNQYAGLAVALLNAEPRGLALPDDETLIRDAARAMERNSVGLYPAKLRALADRIEAHDGI